MDRYFYSVEMDDDNKVVHMFGNIYYNDASWREACFDITEWTGLYLTIDELKALLEDDEFFDFVNSRVDYAGLLNEEEAIEACQVYFNGEPGTWLNIKHVNEDTPCGDYWFE